MKGFKSGIKLVFDLGFEDNMNPAEIRSLASQLGRSYVVMRKAKHPFMMHYVNFKNQVKIECEKMGSHK